MASKTLKKVNKKSLSRLLLIVLSLIVVLTQANSVRASSTNSTGYTTALNNDGKLQIVQDAYLPIGSYSDLNLKAAQDLYIQDQMMYIADTGNGRVIIVDLNTGEREIFGKGFFRSPSGVAADDSGRVYVVDSGKKEAYRFNSDLELEQVFMKPESLRFGLNSQYNPLKIAPGNDGSVYIVNEGSAAGLVHMDRNGSFLGYFGSSDVQVSPFERLIDLILTEEQQSRFLSRTPPSFANVFKAEDGLIYSVNRGSSVQVSRHNIGGLNILENPQAPVLTNAVDMTVTKEGRMYIVDDSGYITEMTADGYLVNIFAGPSDTERAGLFTRPTGIGTDARGNIYVLDQEKNNIQIFEPTRSQSLLHTAIEAYESGNYKLSHDLLQNVIRVNNTSMLAHTYMGKNYMLSNEYEFAAYHFKLAGQIGDYSEAFWEIRNDWIQDNLGLVFMLVIALFAVMMIMRSNTKKRNRAINEGTHVPGRWERFTVNNRFAHDLKQLTYAMTHPTDNAYEVAVLRTGSYTSATTFYTLTFILIVMVQIASGFIYSTNVKNFTFVPTLIAFVLVVLLFTVCNFIIVAIKDGKGTFRSIYITTAYALAPILLLWPVAIFFANVATLNEAFFINLLIVLGSLWAVVCLISALMQIHEYSLVGTIVTVLLTLFAMVVIIIVASLLWLVIQQFIYQLEEMYLEVVIRGQ